MSKIKIISIVIVIATIGTILAIRQGRESAQEKLIQFKIIEDANRLIAEAQNAIDEARRIEESARQEAEALKVQIATDVFKAKSLLDAGQFKQAIDTAKTILSQNAKNAEAKVILKTAMIKLKEIAQQQIDTLTEQEPQKVIEDSDLAPTTPQQ